MQVACPHCGKSLKVPDRSLLGRKARCGKCRQTFVLEEPVPTKRPAPLPGFAAFQGPVEIADLKRSTRSSPAAETAALPTMPRAAEELATPTEGSPAAGGGLAGFPSLEDVDLEPAVDVEESSPLDRLAYQRSKSAKWNWILGGMIAVVLLGLGTAWYALRGSAPSGKTAGAATAKGKPAVEDRQAEDRSSAVVGGAVSPTRGPPITLKLVPMGAQIVFHLRPAELWQPGGPGDEFRACLGPLGVWLEGRIREECLVEPAKIEEVLFALIPVSRDTFETAVVVHTQEEMKRSELIDRFSAELVDRPRVHYVNEKRAYLIQDAKTFAIAPRELADQMLEAIDQPAVTSEGIQSLLPKTDRNRHFTLLAELADVRLGMKSLAPENVRNLLAATVDFFGDDVETVAWSVHLGDAELERGLFSELHVRNRTTRSPPNLREDLSKKLAALPADILKLAYRTNPRKVGEKKLIGRLPIMLKVAERSMESVAAGRAVSMRCILPERAGPNLALGTLLTWNQTTLPEFGKESSQPISPATTVAAGGGTIAQRLQRKIDVEFRDEFLYAAVQFVGDETGITFKLDGAGMKRAGVTQNEKQKFAMQQASAAAILDRILTPRKLVLIVDEQKGVATITGIDEAADKKLQPFPLQEAANPR